MPTPTRRNILAAATALPLAGALQSSVHAAGQDRKIGFAVAGLGGYARNQILPNFENTQHCKPAAFVTSRPAEEHGLAEQYGVPINNIVTYDNIGDLAGRDGVDVLYIITPTGLHMQNTLDGFDAGLHVLCEKPMATDVAECDRMIEAGKKAGKQLMIGYRVHFEPHNLRAMELAGGGSYGRVKHFHGDISYPMGGGGNSWRSNPKLAGGGGPLMDLGIYMVNGARYIIKEEPVRIVGTTYSPDDDPRFPEGIESRCSWQMQFPSGATATSTTAWDLPGQNKYRVLCEEGWFELDPGTGYGGHRLFENRGRRRGQADNIEAGNQFAAMLDHMATCILEGKDNIVPGEEGRQDVKIMKAIYESARAGTAQDL